MEAAVRAVPASRAGAFWQHREILKMLDGMVELEVGALLMPSSHTSNIEVYRRVSALLSARGVRRTPEQIRSKFKRLKGGFYDALEDWQGIPPAESRGRYFSRLQRLWEQADHPSWHERRPAAVRPRFPRRRRGRRQGRQEEEEEEEEDAPAASPEAASTPEAEEMLGPAWPARHTSLSSEQGESVAELDSGEEPRHPQEPVLVSSAEGTSAEHPPEASPKTEPESEGEGAMPPADIPRPALEDRPCCIATQQLILENRQDAMDRRVDRLERRIGEMVDAQHRHKQQHQISQIFEMVRLVHLELQEHRQRLGWGGPPAPPPQR